MGCGEPMLNIHNLMNSILAISCVYSQNCRFALSTCLPINGNFGDFTEMIQNYLIDIKVHLSLNSTIHSIRKEMMPNVMDAESAINNLIKYRGDTGNKVEIHYALMNGINDTITDANSIVSLLKYKNIPIKFLKYNENNSFEAKPSYINNSSEFISILKDANIEVEFYTPPGSDVGASCGQFIKEYYLMHNKKEK